MSDVEIRGERGSAAGDRARPMLGADAIRREVEQAREALTAVERGWSALLVLQQCSGEGLEERRRSGARRRAVELQIVAREEEL